MDMNEKLLERAGVVAGKINEAQMISGSTNNKVVDLMDKTILASQYEKLLRNAFSVDVGDEKSAKIIKSLKKHLLVQTDKFISSLKMQ